MQTDILTCGSEVFQKLSNGATSVMIQLQDDGPIIIVVSANRPDPSSRGIILSRNGPEPTVITINDIPDGDDVYMISMTDGETSTAGVMTNGTIPTQG